MIPWTAGPVEEVLAAYLGGRLPDPQWLMLGCAGCSLAQGMHRPGEGRNGAMHHER